MVPKSKKPGPARTCSCGECNKCRDREARRRYYLNHVSVVIAKNAIYKKIRKDPSYDVEDLVLDKMALRTLGKMRRYKPPIETRSSSSIRGFY